MLQQACYAPAGMLTCHGACVGWEELLRCTGASWCSAGVAPAGVRRLEGVGHVPGWEGVVARAWLAEG